MRKVYLGSFLALLISSGTLFCQGPAASSGSFKLGTFDDNGREFVGAVFNESKVVDLVAANEALQGEKSWSSVSMPGDMIGLIAGYETGLGERVHAIVDASAGATAPYIHDLASLDVEAPIKHPGTMLNAAVNYLEHADETGNVSTREAAKNAPRRSRASGSARRAILGKIPTSS